MPLDQVMLRSTALFSELYTSGAARCHFQSDDSIYDDALGENGNLGCHVSMTPEAGDDPTGALPAEGQSFVITPTRSTM